MPARVVNARHSTRSSIDGFCNQALIRGYWRKMNVDFSRTYFFLKQKLSTFVYDIIMMSN